MADDHRLSSKAGPLEMTLDAGGRDSRQSGSTVIRKPTLPPKAPLLPVGTAELPTIKAGNQNAQTSSTGGLPSSTTSQPTSPLQGPQNDYRSSSNPTSPLHYQQTWGGSYDTDGTRSRVTSSQFEPASAAPAYRESIQYPYGHNQGNTHHTSYYQEPKQPYGVAVAGYAPQPPPTVVPQPAMTEPEKKQICGMRRSTFWFFLTLVLLVFIGALVGGIVGGVVLKSNKSNSNPPDNPNPPDYPVTRLYSSPTITNSVTVVPTTTTTPTTSEPPTKTTSIPTPKYSFPLATGSWPFSGERSLQKGTCIGGDTGNSTVALWKCDQYRDYTFQISSDTEYGFVLSGDQPTRFRAVTPTPPTEGDPYWNYQIDYQATPTAAPVQGNCVLNVKMLVAFGKDMKKPKDNVLLIELAQANRDCILANGMTHPSNLQCGCGYMPVDIIKRGLPLPNAFEML